MLLEFSHVTSSLIDVGQRPQVGRVSLPLILELPDGIFHLGDAYGGCGTFSFSLDHFFPRTKKHIKDFLTLKDEKHISGNVYATTNNNLSVWRFLAEHL